MSWPLTRPMSEAELYRDRLNQALADNPGRDKPTFAMMRHACVYGSPDEWEVPVRAVQRQLGQFENLFRNLGDVENGFPKQISLESLANRDEYNADMLEENLMFGSPDEVIEKLKRYEALGVDEFIYYASMGLSRERQKRSMELFCEKVMPAFA